MRYVAIMVVLTALSSQLSALSQAQPAVGQDADLVRAKLGPPARISRQVYQLHAQEQWHYGAPHQLRLVFDCPRGQKPTLKRIVKVTK
jgi:hypothetical protein